MAPVLTCPKQYNALGKSGGKDRTRSSTGTTKTSARYSCVSSAVHMRHRLNRLHRLCLQIEQGHAHLECARSSLVIEVFDQLAFPRFAALIDGSQGNDEPGDWVEPSCAGEGEQRESRQNRDGKPHKDSRLGRISKHEWVVETLATRVFAMASNGMITTDAARTAMPTRELSGVSGPSLEAEKPPIGG